MPIPQIRCKLDNEAMNGWDPFFNPNHFFFEKNSFLKDYSYEGKHAGQLVEHYAKAYNLNPRIVIMTLQREQGLISAGNKPDDKILNKACGVGVYDDGTIIQKFVGFENQIAGACSTYRKWYDYWKPGMIAELLDKDYKQCMTLSPITFSLLKFTPHLEALTLSEDVYARFFP